MGYEQQHLRKVMFIQDDFFFLYKKTVERRALKMLFYTENWIFEIIHCKRKNRFFKKIKLNIQDIPGIS